MRSSLVVSLDFVSYRINEGQGVISPVRLDLDRNSVWNFSLRLYSKINSILATVTYWLLTHTHVLVSQSASQPASQPASRSVSQPASQPASQSVSQPASHHSKHNNNILGREFGERRCKLSTLWRPRSIELNQPRHSFVSLDLILTETSTYN